MDRKDILADVYNVISQAEKDSIWTQNDIGCGVILCGFFKFQVKKKGENISVNLTGISIKNILEFIETAGFKKRYLPDSNEYLMVKVKDNVMREVTPDIIKVETYQEMLKHEQIYIFIEGSEDSENFDFIFHTDLLQTIYLQSQHLVFNKNLLELMSEFTVPELRDADDTSYFLFENCIVQVENTSHKLVPYSGLIGMNKCVWKSHIKQRVYNEYKGYEIGVFERFIRNVSNDELSRFNAFKSAIGYLLHCRNGQHMGQAVVCYDEAPTDRKNPQGGTGKGLFASGIAQMREVAEIDGKHFKSDDKFRFQTVDITSQVVVIDDLHKDCSFDTFFSCLTSGFTIEKKNTPTIKIKPKDSPKLLFSMNTMVVGGGTSNLRRMFVIEFSDYYSKKIKTGAEKPIEDEHGGIMFSERDWNDLEWDKFTNFMIGCVSFYLDNGLQPYELINVATNTLIQTTSEDFVEWIDEQNFVIGTYYRTKVLFEEFKTRYYGIDSDYKQRTFTNNLGKYAQSKGLDFKALTDPTSKVSEFVFKTKS